MPKAFLLGIKIQNRSLKTRESSNGKIRHQNTENEDRNRGTEKMVKSKI
jgi:hypothetical protein